jgi:hypothetical protein
MQILILDVQAGLIRLREGPGPDEWLSNPFIDPQRLATHNLIREDTPHFKYVLDRFRRASLDAVSTSCPE